MCRPRWAHAPPLPLKARDRSPRSTRTQRPPPHHLLRVRIPNPPSPHHQASCSVPLATHRPALVAPALHTRLTMTTTDRVPSPTVTTQVRRQRTFARTQ